MVSRRTEEASGSIVVLEVGSIEKTGTIFVASSVSFTAAAVVFVVVAAHVVAFVFVAALVVSIVVVAAVVVSIVVVADVVVSIVFIAVKLEISGYNCYCKQRCS